MFVSRSSILMVTQAFYIHIPILQQELLLLNLNLHPAKTNGHIFIISIFKINHLYLARIVSFPIDLMTHSPCKGKS